MHAKTRGLPLLVAMLVGLAGAARTAAAPDPWWSSFQDAELSRVVARVDEANLDIAAASARLDEARALARAAGAALAPRADLQTSVARGAQSLDGQIGEIGRHLPGFHRAYADYALGGVAQWDLDLSGGSRAARRAATARADAAAALLAATRLDLEAQAAEAYLNARALRARLSVTRRREAVQADLVDLVERRRSEGVASDREAREARAALEGVRAGIPPLTAALSAQLDRLDVLMGAQPGTWRAELDTDAPQPRAPTPAMADGPARLLRRRPDLAAAEASLKAADADVGAAVAQYYPDVSISALLGLDSLDASRVFSADALQNQVAAGLRWRLFDFGRIDAEVAQARGRRAEALATYRAAALRAAEEVADAFVTLDQQGRRARALEAQIADLEAARDQAALAYANGVVGLIEVRDADRDLLTATDALAQARADAALAAVAAYRALGGGWGG